MKVRSYCGVTELLFRSLNRKSYKYLCPIRNLRWEFLRTNFYLDIQQRHLQLFNCLCSYFDGSVIFSLPESFEIQCKKDFFVKFPSNFQFIKWNRRFLATRSPCLNKHKSHTKWILFSGYALNSKRIKCSLTECHSLALSFWDHSC